MQEPTQKELIELEVKRAIAQEVEGYRKTLEQHQAYLKESTVWFGRGVVALAVLALGIFYYFFGRSIDGVPTLVKAEVRNSPILVDIKAEVEKNTSPIVPELTTKATNQIATEVGAFQLSLTRSAEAKITQKINDYSAQLMDGEFKRRAEEAATKWIANATNLTDIQKAQFFNAVPVGTIIAYGGKSPDPKSGWLLCNGDAIPRDGSYGKLFDAIGTAWGEGNGKTTFNLPDLQGLFLRGVDGSAGRDPDSGSRESLFKGGNSGNDIGSIQNDATKLPNKDLAISSGGEHSHSISGPAAADDGGSSDTHFAIGDGKDRRSFPKLTVGSAGNHTHTVNGGDAETRPKNAYVYYIIKY